MASRTFVLCLALLASPLWGQAPSWPSQRHALAPEACAANRERFLARLRSLGPGTVAVVRCGTVDRDEEMVDGNFHFLTGQVATGATAFLDPGSDKPFTLVLPSPPPEGLQPTADRVEPGERLTAVLKEYLYRAERVVVVSGRDKAFVGQVAEVLFEWPPSDRRGFGKMLQDGRSLVEELRVLKQPAEIAALQAAVDMTVEGQLAALRASRPGVNEAVLAKAFQDRVQELGATGLAFPTIAATGPNTCEPHYAGANKDAPKGALALMDSGATAAHYCGDVTRTWPVEGRFSPEQRKLYDLVLKAQRAALARVKPGVGFHEPNAADMEVLNAGLVELGLLKGPVEECLKQRAYFRFTLHPISHYVGLGVHDPGSMSAEDPTGRGKRPLEPGMVLTIEPGLYIAHDVKNVEARWQGIGIRIEDTVLVTLDGCKVLSEAMPKDPEVLEKLVQAAQKQR